MTSGDDVSAGVVVVAGPVDDGGSVPVSAAGPSAEPPSGLNGGQSSVSRHR